MEHFYQSINGWSHYLSPWYEYIVSQLPPDPCVVEVGCWHGRSTACLAVELINHHEQFKLWAVDHWLGCFENHYEVNSVKHAISKDEPYRAFLKNLAPVLDKINIIRDTSVHAAAHFADNSLDMVILDDDHGKDSVINSIMAWMPKVKPGGYLCGDDHDGNYPGVINAAREIFGSNPTDYKLFTNTPGWGIDGINGNGVWVVNKSENWQPPVVIIPADPWTYKVPFVQVQVEIPEPEPEPEPEPQAPKYIEIFHFKPKNKT